MKKDRYSMRVLSGEKQNLKAVKDHSFSRSCLNTFHPPKGYQQFFEKGSSIYYIKRNGTEDPHEILI